MEGRSRSVVSAILMHYELSLNLSYLSSSRLRSLINFSGISIAADIRTSPLFPALNVAKGNLCRLDLISREDASSFR